MMSAAVLQRRVDLDRETAHVRTGDTHVYYNPYTILYTYLVRNFQIYLYYSIVRFRQSKTVKQLHVP